MLWSQALSSLEPPSRPTFERWLQIACASGRLRKVREGVYLNAMGNRQVSPAAAAGHIRRAAVPSLSWVLEQEWALNNFGDVVTCVVPQSPGQPVPSVGSVRTPMGEFRFRAMPAHVLEPVGVDVADWRDSRFLHPRATPEKALCDWIYLGLSARSTLPLPPLDLDMERLDTARLRRLTKAMGIEAGYLSWLVTKRIHDADPDVLEGAPTRGRLRKV